MTHKKIFAFLLISLFLIISIGAVSADDNATKTFDDVTQLIKDAEPNTEITLDGKYVSQGSAIKVTENLNITGKNNAVLDANKSSSIVSATKNLVFKNLTFMNANTKDYSIYSKGSLTFINCTFVNNVNKNQPTVCSDAKLNMVNCTFKNNDAHDYVAYGSQSIILKDSVFENNKAEHLVYAESGSKIENTRFINNPKAIAIYTSYDINIINCDFMSNRWGISAESYGGKINIKNSRFNKNVNGIYINTFYVDINVDNTSFTDNSNYGIYTLGNSKITNSNFTNNKYAFKSQTPNEEGYEIPLPNKGDFDRCIFKSNTAGAIITDNSMTIKNSIFDKNHGEMAGAISSRNADAGNTIKITNSTFTNNSAEYAGAIKASGTVLTISSSTFADNTYTNIIITSIIAHDDLGEKYINEAKLTVNSKTFTKSANLDDNLKQVNFVKVTVSKVTTTYDSGAKLTVKLINTFTNKPVKNSVITLKVFTGTKSKNYEVSTNKEGIATFSASTLAVGTHKIEILSNYGVCKIAKTTTSVKVTKAKTIAKAPKVTAKYKKTKYFKVTLKNKATNKAAKNVLLNLKIGKKTHKVKTDSKGIAKFNTNKLGYGNHKVTISSGNSNYMVSAKSSITIR